MIEELNHSHITIWKLEQKFKIKVGRFLEIGKKGGVMN